MQTVRLAMYQARQMNLKDFIHGVFVLFPQNVARAWREQLPVIVAILAVVTIVNLASWLGLF